MLSTTMRYGSRGWTKFASHEHTSPTVRSLIPIEFFLLFKSRESAWIKLQLAWPEAALPRCAGVMVVPSLRRPASQSGRCSAAFAHLCEGIRAGRQTGRLSLCRFQK